MIGGSEGFAQDGASPAPVPTAGREGIRRIGFDPVGRLLGPTAGLVSDVSKAAGVPIDVATGDGITDSQAEGVKRLVPFQVLHRDAAGARSAHGRRVTEISPRGDNIP